MNDERDSYEIDGYPEHFVAMKVSMTEMEMKQVQCVRSYLGQQSSLGLCPCCLQRSAPSLSSFCTSGSSGCSPHTDLVVLPHVPPGLWPLPSALSLLGHISCTDDCPLPLR